MSSGRGAALLAGALLLSEPALAHVAGVMGYATLDLHGSTVRYRLTLGLDALEALGGYQELGSLVARKVAIAADSGRCEPVPGPITSPTPDRASATVIVDYACPGAPTALMLRDDLADRLGGDYHTLVRFEGGQQETLEANRREARFGLAASAPAVPAATGGLFAFFRMGVEHILTGVDHLLFLLALILRGGGIRALLGIVTAFTGAHSITLGMTVLGGMSPPSWIVEPAIALSIIYVAAENLFRERAISHRSGVAFLFGLVHGIGFGAALLELEVPAAARIGMLVSFNVGVEAGQALVLSALVPALAWLQRWLGSRRAVAALSAVVLVAGLAFLVDRVLDTAS